MSEVIEVIKEMIGDVPQYKFAQQVGIDPTILSAILNGRRGISKEVAKKLSAHSGKPLEEFLK